MSMIFASADSRKVTVGPNDRVVTAELLATAITCIADLVGQIEGAGKTGGRVMQFEERIAVDVAKQVKEMLRDAKQTMNLLMGDEA